MPKQCCIAKPKNINDLYTSQAEVFEEWYNRRNEKDIVVKATYWWQENFGGAFDSPIYSE